MVTTGLWLYRKGLEKYYRENNSISRGGILYGGDFGSNRVGHRGFVIDDPVIVFQGVEEGSRLGFTK